MGFWLESQRQLGIARYGWEDNTTVDLREIQWDGIVWIYLDDMYNGRLL
jgi:hypothetical protein